MTSGALARTTRLVVGAVAALAVAAAATAATEKLFAAAEALLAMGLTPDLLPTTEQSAKGLLDAWPAYDAQLDPINPQVAARLARCFDRWKRFDGEHQCHAKAALELLRQLPALSPDVFEVVDKALG